MGCMWPTEWSNLAYGISGIHLLPIPSTVLSSAVQSVALPHLLFSLQRGWRTVVRISTGSWLAGGGESWETCDLQWGLSCKK